MTLIGHDSWVQAITFHPGGKYLLSVSDDKTIRCWDLGQEGKCVKTIEAHESFVTCLRWAPGVDKNVPGGDGAPDGQGKGNPPSNVEIRCVIATGGWDWKLKIFAG
jgi:platelet-activating factor acetylhydrolase IB subunit alpha